MVALAAIGVAVAIYCVFEAVVVCDSKGGSCAASSPMLFAVYKRGMYLIVFS